MKAAFLEPDVITRKGKPVSVILPIKVYERMMEKLEDAADVAYLEKASRRTLHFRPLADVLTDRAKSQ